METKTILTRKEQKALLASAFQELRWSVECHSSLDHRLDRLVEVIKKGEKHHYPRRPGNSPGCPRKDAVNYFVVRTITSALRTIGKRKTVPVSELTVRADYLLALGFIAEIRGMEKTREKILPSEVVRQIFFASDNTDYTDLF